MGHEPLVASLVEALRRQADVSGGWMVWNLFLALTVWVLSVVLFRPHRRPRPVWLAVAVGWSLLLPNAAYVLTDVVHLPAAVRQEPSDHLVLLVVLPLYGAFFTAGFVAYADGLRRLRRHVTGLGWVRRGWTVEAAVHAASAFAIYLGRIHRLNSWDVVRQPLAIVSQTAVGFTRPMAIAGIIVMFAALAVGQLVAAPILDTLEEHATRLAGRLRTRPT